MATYSKQLLSGSTDGRGVKVAASATPGTTIHTAHASAKDEIWLWATNTDSVARRLTLEVGGTTSPDDLIQRDIPANSGPILVCPGLVLTNSKVLRAFGAAANVITLHGFVNRITG